MKIEGAIKDYTGKDLARTFKQLQPSPERKSELINQDYRTLMSEGYVIIENLMTPSQCAQIKNQCMPLMRRDLVDGRLGWIVTFARRKVDHRRTFEK